MHIYIYVYNTAVLINICRFLINVVKLCKPLSKLDLPTLLKGSTEERTQRGFVGAEILHRVHALAYHNHSFITCVGPEASISTTISKKCGAKNKLGKAGTLHSEEQLEFLAIPEISLKIMTYSLPANKVCLGI